MILSDQYRGINSKEFKQILDRKPVPLVNAPLSKLEIKSNINK